MKEDLMGVESFMSPYVLTCPDIADSKAKTLFDLALEHMSAERLDLALVCFGRIQKLYPFISEADYYLGYIYFLKSDYKSAIHEFNIRLAKSTDCVLSSYFRGLCRAELGLHQEALRDFSDAIECDRGFFSAYLSRGELRSELLDFAGAVEDFSRAIELDPESSDAWYGRALVYDDYNEYNLALRDFDQSIRLEPKNADAICGRGLLLLRLGHDTFALSDFDKCLDIDPSIIEAWLEKTRILRSAGKYHDALRCINDAIKQESLPEFLQERASLNLELGNSDKAYSDFSRFVSARLEEENQ